MAATMSKKSKKENLEKMRICYAGRCGKKRKTALIDEFGEVAGHNRKHGIQFLTGNRGIKKSGGCPGEKSRLSPNGAFPLLVWIHSNNVSRNSSHFPPSHFPHSTR